MSWGGCVCVCVQHSCRGGERLQRVCSEAAKAVMSGLSSLVFYYRYEANTQNLLLVCWGLMGG